MDILSSRMGPWVCRLNIGPIPVRMPVYVTSDPHFGTDFILGRNDWPTMPLKTMQVLQETSYNEAHVRCEGGPEGVELRTLVDTGAGINVLSYAAFCRDGLPTVGPATQPLPIGNGR